MAYITIKGFNKQIPAAGIYHNSSLGLITISDGTNVITIADKNLGATVVYNEGDTLSQSNCGKYYQWGNNYGFPRTGTITNTSLTQVNASTYGPTNYYSSSTWIKHNNDWTSDHNNNLWGDDTDTVEARRGPCDEGFHIPSHDEQLYLRTIRDNLGFVSGQTIYLKMPNAGSRTSTNTNVSSQGISAYYRSSTPTIYINSGIQEYRAWEMSCSNLSFSPNGRIIRSFGASIRPFKNNIVMPDSSWTTIYDGNAPLITTAGIYHSPAKGLISLSKDGVTWYTISDKNQGAYKVYNYGDAIDYYNCGNFYQRGNNYGFTLNGPGTTSSTPVNASNYGPGNYYNSATWITNTRYWDSSMNRNLWGGTTGTLEARQGPCYEGWHVPSDSELSYLIGTLFPQIGISLTVNNLSQYLKLPLSGCFRPDSFYVQPSSSGGYLWTSDSNSNGSLAYYTGLITGSVYTSHTDYPGYGYNIRAFKNTAVQPDSNRTVLYQ